LRGVFAAFTLIPQKEEMVIEAKESFLQINMMKKQLMISAQVFLILSFALDQYLEQ